MMKKAIIGKKVGMTQIFDANGKVIPVTVIEAGPCVVVQKKTVEKDGYSAVQLGFQDELERKLTKPEIGHLKKADVELKKFLREFRLENVDEMNVGDTIKADVFAEGDKIDVTGISKGKGYAGVIKRYGAHMGAEQITVQNLDVVKVDPELNLIAIRGAIPGPKGGIVCIKNTVKNNKVKTGVQTISANPQKASGRNPQKASARMR